MFRPLLVVALIAAPLAAVGAPPVGGTGEFAPWFQSLTDRHGISCCSESDCRHAEYRTRGGNFEVFIDKATFGSAAPDKWVVVPEDTVLPRENPTGEGVVCWYGGAVRCFVQGGAT